MDSKSNDLGGGINSWLPDVDSFESKSNELGWGINFGKRGFQKLITQAGFQRDLSSQDGIRQNI